MSTLVFADDSIPQAVARISPSIVRIQTFGGSAQTAINPGDGPTTGIFCSPDGYILTSTFNFLRKPPVITVTLSDGSQHVAQLLGRDDQRNLCILKIDTGAPGPNLPTPTWLSMSDARVGQSAITAGVGYGPDQPAIAVGIISALHRITGVALQTDANTSPANYGGPLIDLDGRVLGIIVPLIPDSQSSGELGEGAQWYDSGIGFAIPIADIQPLIQRMKNGDTLKRGFIGIATEDHESDPPGITITAVTPDSPAQKSDLHEQDIITHINAQPIINLHELRRALAHTAAGDEISLTFQRGDESLDVHLTLATGPFTGLPPERLEEAPTQTQPSDDAE